MQKTGDITKPERNSSIELLRIIVMLMIVGCHFATHGGFSFDKQAITIPRLWWNVIEMGGNFGVDVFVLISGYYLVTDRYTGINVKKTCKLWGQIFFYSVALFLLAFVIGKGTLTPSSIIKALLPVSSAKWWFASTYFVMYLLHPYLNRILLSLNKKQYQTLIALSLVIWSIIPTFTTFTIESNVLLEFLMYYSIAGYIRLYGLNPSIKSKHWLILWLSFSFVTYLSSLIFMALGMKIESFDAFELHFYSRQSILTILRSVSFFMAFTTWKIKSNRFINTASSATFGVYLLHDSDLLRPYLWNEVFKNASFQNTLLLIPYSIIVILVVYIVCTIIDLGRHYLIETPYLKLVDASSNRLRLLAKKLMHRINSAAFGKED